MNHNLNGHELGEERGGGGGGEYKKGHMPETILSSSFLVIFGHILANLGHIQLLPTVTG